MYFVLVKPYEKMTLAQLKEAEDEFDEEELDDTEVTPIQQKDTRK